MADETAIPGKTYGLMGKETTWGTAVTCDKDIGIIKNFTPTEDRSIYESGGLGSVNLVNLPAMDFESNASLELEMQHGRPLEYVFGSVAHVETTGDWKHTFSEADALPSFTYEDGFNSTNDNVITFSGGIIKTATISAELGGVLMFKGDIGFKAPTASTTASTIVVSTIQPLTYAFASLKTGADGSEVTHGEVKSFSVTVDEGYKKIRGFGSQLAVGYYRVDHRKYNFEFTMAFRNNTDYQLFLGGAVTPSGTSNSSIPSVIFNLNNGIALGSGRLEFNIDFSTAVYSAFDKPSMVGDVIYQTFKGQAKSITSANTWFVDTITSALWS